MKDLPTILLDSGAFSAFTLAKPIDLDSYMSFIKRNEHLIDHYVSLDVIPGSDGGKKAAEDSYLNQQKMKDAGLSPIPVVHYDDDLHWLERYLDDDEPYIGLSPIKRNLIDAIRFLDACFSLIKDRRPTVKTHGFGVTTAILCTEYPWTSIDSTTWLRQAGAGQILVPIYVDGKPDYSLRARSISISDRAIMRPNHIDDLGEFEREQVQHFLLEEVGIELDEVRVSAKARWRVNIVYFKGLEAACKSRLFFATGTHETQRRVLLQCGARHHLLSYFVMQHRPDALQRYVGGDH